MDRFPVRLILLCFISFCEQDVDIYSFHINSTVTSRYAITVITSRVANRLNSSKEIHFQVKIPKNAFISKFKLTTEGKTYDGVVKQKEEAQQQYSQAVSRGESAGMVSSVGRTLEDFKTSVTVAAFSKVTFELTYEELLKRRLGKYQLLINAQPMQPVADYKIDVYIQESPGISFLKVEGELATHELGSAQTTTIFDKEHMMVNFYPTREQQTMCKRCSENGLSGDLLIIYDVIRPKPSGELQASNGYFVHYFAPTDIQRIPKNVVFVIDKSGSMRGQKIIQTRLAMLKILGDLTGDDYFGLITFDSQVQDWKPELLQATERNLDEAKTFVNMIKARGGTDIDSAVLAGVEVINSHPRQGSASILILLTDGDPTAGETNPESIQASVKSAIQGKFPLYCLGFGFDVSFNFLEKMALENNGVARRIYEDSDADLQLQGFFEEIATPLLTDVQMNYVGAENVTQASFTQYYNGSEIVVAGQITDNSLETFQTEVIAISKHNNVTYQDSVSIIDFTDVLPEDENFIQRLWAYLTVKQLLDRQLTLSDHEKEMVRKKALYLSLKYKFVTPLTSMVVTKPQEEQTQVAHKPSEEESNDNPIQRPIQNPNTKTNTKCQFSLSPPAGGVRFIISAQPKPICYDMPADHKLRLLQDSSSNFSMNGELSSNGFNLIFLHYKTDHLMLSTKEIHYYDGQNMRQTGKKETVLSLNLLQNNQMDVTMGTVCVGVLRHEKDGDTFLWPVVKQPPSNITATDYQNSSTPTVQCWLVPFQFALQGELSDFKVLQL
uniref:Inter-alpha-trypsin inhibitor heavy chain H3-like n=1 Tax=Electrophorus electricus TaxID=8005 RepID=A0A4W4E269_ELEEL